MQFSLTIINMIIPLVFCVGGCQVSHIHIERFSYNRSEIRIVDTQATYSQARNMCEKMGGKLVIIDSQNKQRFIKTILQGRGNNQYRIGGFYYAGSWVLGNGVKISYTNWAEGQPGKNGKTIVLDRGKQWRWRAVSRDKVCGFVCELD